MKRIDSLKFGSYDFLYEPESSAHPGCGDDAVLSIETGFREPVDKNLMRKILTTLVKASNELWFFSEILFKKRLRTCFGRVSLLSIVALRFIFHLSGIVPCELLL